MAQVNISKTLRDELDAGATDAGATLLRKKGERAGLVLAVETIVDNYDKAASKPSAKKSK